MLSGSFNIDRKMHDKIPEEAIKQFHRQLSTHKHVEIEFFKVNYLIGIGVDLNFTGRDHAGPHFEFRIWGYELYIHFYDNRNWNPKTNNWQETEEEGIKENA